MPPVQELMPYSHHEQTPSWVFENSTTRVLISDTGNAFMLDCGYQRVIDDVKQLITRGVSKKVKGIFVTHYHRRRFPADEARTRIS